MKKNIGIIIGIIAVLIIISVIHRYLPLLHVRREAGLQLPLSSKQLSVENGDWYQIRWFRITSATADLLIQKRSFKKPVPMMLTTLINDTAGLPEWQYSEISPDVYIVLGPLNRSEPPSHLWVIRLFEDQSGDAPL